MKNGPALAGYGPEAMRQAIAAQMATMPEQLRRSLTWDRGTELAQHAQLKIDTGIAVYFADPRSPWQRGSNENTNLDHRLALPTMSWDTGRVEEIPLMGGNISAGVVRVGHTVRRPAGVWTPAVHALLRHLEGVGFDRSPRVLGFDEKGREVLTYLDGVCLSLDAPDLLVSLETVWKAGALAADLTAALQTFIAPANAHWWQGSVDPCAGSTIIHNDLAPWNVIVNGDEWGLIDWDFAGPGRFEWEASYTLHTFGLLPALDLSDTEVVARIRSFGDGARLSTSALTDVLRLVPLRTKVNAEMIERLAAEGHPGYTAVERKGHARDWRTASEHVRNRMTHWLAKLGLAANR